MTLYKVFKYLALAIGGVAFALFLWLLSIGDDAITAEGTDGAILSGFTALSWITLILTIVPVLIFVIVSLLNSSNLKVTLGAIGAFILIFLVAYLTGSSEGYTMANGTQVSGSLSQWVETGLNMFYILAAIAVLALIASSVRNLTLRN